MLLEAGADKDVLNHGQSTASGCLSLRLLSPVLSRVFAAGETALDAALKVKLPHHTGTHHAKGHTQHHQKKTDLLRLLHDDL